MQISKDSPWEGRSRTPSMKRRLEAEAGVLGLQQAADALDQRNGGQGLEIFVDCRAQFERRVGHDPADPAVLPGKTGHPLRFLDVLAGVAFALHEDHLLHLNVPAGLPVFFQQVPLVQQRNIVQPAVPQVIRVPEMHVGVYNGEVQHGIDPQKRRFKTMLKERMTGKPFYPRGTVSRQWESRLFCLYSHPGACTMLDRFKIVF